MSAQLRSAQFNSSQTFQLSWTRIFCWIGLKVEGQGMLETAKSPQSLICDYTTNRISTPDPVQDCMYSVTVLDKNEELLIKLCIKTAVFWNAALCSLVDIDRHFRGAYCLHHLPDYTVQHPRRKPSSYLSL
jgi:hypothetical protein